MSECHYHHHHCHYHHHYNCRHPHRGTKHASVQELMKFYYMYGLDSTIYLGKSY